MTKSLRDTSLWAILANRHPAMWEEIIGPLGPLARLDTVALDPQQPSEASRIGPFSVTPVPLSLADMGNGVRYGIRTAFAVVRAAGVARLLNIAIADFPDICPPTPPPFPPLPEPPDPIPWRVALERIPNFYADYALGLAIGLEASAGEWEELPSGEAISKLHEQASAVAAN